MLLHITRYFSYKYIWQSCSFLFFLTYCFLFVRVFLLDIFQFLEVLLGYREGFGRQFFTHEVEISQSLFVWVLFSTLEDYFGQLLGTFFSFCIHGLEQRDVVVQHVLYFLQVGFLLCYVFLMSLKMLLICRISFLFKDFFVSQKCLDDWSQFCEIFLEILIDISIAFNTSIFLSVINSFLLLSGDIAFRIHGWH